MLALRVFGTGTSEKELGKRLEEMEKDIEESALARAVGGMREGGSEIVGWSQLVMMERGRWMRKLRLEQEVYVCQIVFDNVIVQLISRNLSDINGDHA